MRTPLFSEPLIIHRDVIINMLTGLNIAKLISCDLLNVFIYFTAANALFDTVVFGNLLVIRRLDIGNFSFGFFNISMYGYQ